VSAINKIFIWLFLFSVIFLFLFSTRSTVHQAREATLWPVVLFVQSVLQRVPVKDLVGAGELDPRWCRVKLGAKIMAEPNANAIVAAILAAVRIMRQGVENATTTRAAYIDEWQKMLLISA
jgi:hypothetical protein